MSEQGILYICPTPIGNLKDITQRVLDVLASVDCILCEDTRVSSKLLNHYSISTKLMSYHKFNEKEQVQKIAEMLENGKNLALISDAGTPLINDPGIYIVNELNNRGIKIVPLPGASALTTFMSAVFNPGGRFVFAGFAPRGEKQLEQLVEEYNDTTLVLFESPNRLMKTLEFLAKNYPEKTVAIGRELTKINEEILHLSPSEVVDYYKKNTLKGELIIALINTEAKKDNFDDNLIISKIKKLQKLDYSSKDIAKIISALDDVPKNYVYGLIL